MSTLVAAAPGVFWRETKAEFLKAARMPMFAIPTVLLPVGFYALFAVGMGRGDQSVVTQMLATFGVYAVMGPALFGFGANVASERESGQLELKRLSPMPTGAHIVGKLVATMAFSAIAIALIYAVAAMVGVNLSASQWALMASTQITAVIPFALIGLGVGYRMGSKSAVAIVNVLFLGMAVMGGLWIPLALMPEAIKTIAWVLPSYHLGELALMAVGHSEIAYFWLHAGPLGLLSLAAAVFAWTGQQRHDA